MLFFSNVDTVDPTSIKWSAIRFQRNNQTYRMLISLCQLIVQGMLLTTDSGEYKLASFIDEQRMSRLYEKFILEYYNKEFPAINASASQIPWILDDGVGTMLPVMQSDIMLSHIQNIGSGCQVSRKYHVEDGVSSLLDDFDSEDFFAHTDGNPPDVVVNPLETKDYKITIDYLYGEQRVLTGTFDKNGLPDDFSDFAETVFDFMRFYGMGEILDPSVHDKALRKQTDFIFCNVQFDEYGKTYCYLTNDDTLEVGDRVVVPVGQDNHKSFAQIESIEYRPAEEAPFPIEKTKKIIRRAKEEDDVDDSVDFPEDAVIMASEPLSGITPAEWRSKLGENYSDEELATALAGAWNECGWLGHDLDDDDCTQEIISVHDAWWSLEKELIAEIARRIDRKCETPYIKLITPFMEQNGYRDGGGWWVKNNASSQHK